MYPSKIAGLFICVLVLITGCKKQEIEATLSFPVREVRRPSDVLPVYPEPVTDSGRRFLDVRLYQDKLLYLSSPLLRRGSASSMLYVEDKSGKEIMSLFPMGRGPGEMLSPLPYMDIYEGHVYLVDVMNSKLFDADLSESLSRRQTVIKQTVVLEHESASRTVFPSFYAIDGSNLLAFDTGLTGAELDGEYSYAPRYLRYDLLTGKKVQEYECFDLGKVPTKASKKIKQPAFSLNDCMDDKRQRLCFAMSKAPILGFIDVRGGEMFGVKVKNAKIRGKNTLSRFYFGPIVSKGGRIYAIYYGALGDKTQRTPDLYVFDWQGELLKVYQLDTYYNHIWSEEDGLYLTKVESEESGMIVCRIPWGKLE